MSAVSSPAVIFSALPMRSEKPRAQLPPEPRKLVVCNVSIERISPLSRSASLRSFSFYASKWPFGLTTCGRRAKLPRPQKLSGSLANFDLITVHQTIISSGQTGELEVLNAHNERMATFFFQGGALRSGQFQQLTGEEAFWQLFLSDDIPGSFSFASGSNRLPSACNRSKSINLPTTCSLWPCAIAMSFTT